VEYLLLGGCSDLVAGSVARSAGRTSSRMRCDTTEPHRAVNAHAFHTTPSKSGASSNLRIARKLRRAHLFHIVNLD